MKKLGSLISKKKEEKPIENEDSSPTEQKTVTRETRGFIVVTEDLTGLGWAKKLKDEGNDVILAVKLKDTEEKKKEAEMVGKGIVDVQDLDQVFDDRKDFKDWYWIFDMNIHTEIAKTLNEEGFKILGGQEISEKLEHDRDFASDFMEHYGIKSPPTYEFKSIEDGIKFLEENPEKAFVFKPDEPNGLCCTYVPDSEKNEKANNELSVYLSSLSDAGTYILQERIKGVEANFEVWFYKGKPFFAMCDLECKKKLNHDFGRMVGCAQDVNFSIPLECKAIKTTIAKLYDYYKEIKYTGFVDVNVIVFDNENYYLESCNRFGYNSHPNILMAVAKLPVGEILASFLDGDIHDFYDKMRYGFGASITLYLDDTKTGLPLFIDEDVVNDFFLFDGYKERNQYFVSGYCNEIGVITAHAYTIREAGEEVLEKAKMVNFPTRAFRSDIDKNDYKSSIEDRYAALESMNYFDK